MRLYRIELDSENGCWYNKNCEYCCSEPILIAHAMPSEPNVYKGIYKSACATLEDLFWWVDKKLAIKNGYKLAVYESEDYFERKHGEICFNKNNYLYRKELDLLEYFGGEL